MSNITKRQAVANVASYLSDTAVDLQLIIQELEARGRDVSLVKELQTVRFRILGASVGIAVIIEGDTQ